MNRWIFIADLSDQYSFGEIIVTHDHLIANQCNQIIKLDNGQQIFLQSLFRTLEERQVYDLLSRMCSS